MLLFWFIDVTENQISGFLVSMYANTFVGYVKGHGLKIDFIKWWHKNEINHEKINIINWIILSILSLKFIDFYWNLFNRERNLGSEIYNMVFTANIRPKPIKPLVHLLKSCSLLTCWVYKNKNIHIYAWTFTEDQLYIFPLIL